MATNNRIKNNKTMPKKSPQSPLSTEGIIIENNSEPEKITEEKEIPVQTIEEKVIKSEIESNITMEKVEPKKDEIAVEHINAEVVEDKKEENLLDLFNIKKKEKTIYLAAPFTALADTSAKEHKEDIYLNVKRGHGVLPKGYQIQLTNISKVLEEKWKTRVILPHKDVNKWGKKELSSEEVLNEIVRNLKDSNMIIAIPSNSIGVHLELGIALAQNKPIIIFDVGELTASFYLQGFAIRNNIMVKQVKTIAEIPKILSDEQLIMDFKKMLEEDNNEIY
jgi:nucleoside 2-deoxyribosyltransferase